MRTLINAAIVSALAVLAVHAFAASPTPLPSFLAGLQTQATGSGAIAGSSYLDDLSQTFMAFGGMAWYLKVATVLMLLVASMKVTALDDLLWSKLGAFQAAAAPILSLVAGFFMLWGQGTLSLKGLLVYLSTGFGAIALHETLDMAKGLPWLGPGYKAVIAWVENTLGGNSTPNPAPGDPPAPVASSNTKPAGT